MRNDYFTTTELSKLIHVGPSTIHKYVNKPGYFSGVKTGQLRGNTIIPKAQFFDWYFKAYNVGKLHELFPFAKNLKHAEILQAYQDYTQYKLQNNETLRREFLRNKRPAYRRKGSYYES